MYTFGGNLQLAAILNLDLLVRLVARRLGHVLDLLDNIVALGDLAKDDVLAVEPPGYLSASGHFTSVLRGLGIRGDGSGDEELGAVGVLAGVGHGQETLLGVLELEVFILELFAVDWGSSQHLDPTGRPVSGGAYSKCHPFRHPL